MAKASDADTSPMTIMTIGLGKLGGAVMDHLLTRCPTHRFVCVARDEQLLALRTNLSRYQAAQWGAYPEVIVEQCDLTNIAATAECLGRHTPDIVFNATTPFPWWRISELPKDLAARAEQAGPGMWSALDCLLPLRLTEAIAASSLTPTHVNACYADMTNVFLSGMPAAPVLGIGNLSNLVPGLRLAFAEELDAAPPDLEIRLVAHHAVSWTAPNASGTRAPFHLAVSHPGGKLVYEGQDDRCFAILRRRASRTRGLSGLGVTAGSAATVLAALLDGQGGAMHCPGALGHPGGYPVRISTDREVQLDLDETLDFADALEINRVAQQVDGVAHVEAGRTVPTETAREAFFAIVGMELDELTMDNVDDIASETLQRLDSLYRLGLAR